MQPTYCISTSTSAFPIVELTGSNKPAIGGFPIFATTTCPSVVTNSVSNATMTVQLVDRFGNITPDVTILIPFLSLFAFFI